jgi:hypothetical protein
LISAALVLKIAAMINRITAKKNDLGTERAVGKRRITRDI